MEMQRRSNDQAGASFAPSLIHAFAASPPTYRPLAPMSQCGFPAAIAMLFKALTEEQEERVSEAWFTVPLVMLAAPLTWVADRFPLYQDYLECLFETAGLV